MTPRSFIRVVLLAAAVGSLSGTAAHAELYDVIKLSIAREMREARDLTTTLVEPTTADAPTQPELVTPHGMRERRALRVIRWHEALQGDRQRIHEQMGHPTYRTYKLESGVRTELWTYPEADRTYVFEGDRLIETRLD